MDGCGCEVHEKTACDEYFPQSNSTCPSCGFDDTLLVFFHLMQSTCHWWVVMRHGFDLILNQASTAVSTSLQFFPSCLSDGYLFLTSLYVSWRLSSEIAPILWILWSAKLWEVEGTMKAKC